MKRLWILPVLLAVMPAFAAEWVRLRTPVDGDQYYYDRSKLYISGDEVTYWKKVAFKTPQPTKGLLAASGLYRERIHCAEHTLKLISYLLYAGDGSTIEYVASHEGDAAPIIPDTLGDVFEKAACNLVRQKHEEQRRKPVTEPIKIDKEPVPPTPEPTPEPTSEPTSGAVASDPKPVPPAAPITIDPVPNAAD